MINLMRITLPILGVALILGQIIRVGSNCQGLDSPIWGLLLGFGLIFTPVSALLLIVGYIFFVGIPLGLGIVGALTLVDLFGKGVWGVAGFVGGGWLGFKFVMSDAYNRFFRLFRSIGKEYDECER